MWWGSSSDPGGSGGEAPPKDPPPNQQLLDLQEQFEQQQTFIAQLKEMLRKTEQSSVSREKMEEYASTLNEINARAKRSKMKKSETKRTESDEGVKVSSEASGRKPTVNLAIEKSNLFRQQLEENKAKLAQRDKNQKGIEEIVNQLKAQLDDSQVIISQSQMNFPKMESKLQSSSDFSLESSKEELLSILKARDNHIVELNTKLQQLQANVLDLQENVKEKDSVIEARTKAITLLSENLSKKSKNTVDLLDETKEQMRAMQENFVALETKMKQENLKLQAEVTIKENKIQELLEANDLLESKCNDLEETNKKLQEIETTSIVEGTSKTDEKIEKQSLTQDESEKETNVQKTKRNKNAKKQKLPTHTTQANELQSYLDRIAGLEKEIEDLQCTNQELQQEIENTDKDSEVNKLNKQLEEMNKAMIKMKAQQKAKLKEMQKKSNNNELNEKISGLELENQTLGHRIAELEDEKGNLQLRLCDYESNKEKDYIADLENKIEEQKMEIENHIRAITSLESQITSSSNEISSLRNKLSTLMHLENAQVCSEMTSVQLEEQLDKVLSQKKEIQDNYNEIVKENEALLEKIEMLNKEKQELSAKLDNYMQENMDLIDRLEKLSAEKVSSAESIEIVEGLTQQEKLELEEYQKNLDFIPDKPMDDNSELEQNPELNESVSKLTEETSELMERIELFTVERKEVMEKMDSLLNENQQLISKLEKYGLEKVNLEEKCNDLCSEKDVLITKLEELDNEKNNLIRKAEESFEENIVLNQRLDSVQCKLIDFETQLGRKASQIEKLEVLLTQSNDDIPGKEKEEKEKLLAENNLLREQIDVVQNQCHLLQKQNEEVKQNLTSVSEMVFGREELAKHLLVAEEKAKRFETELFESTKEIENLTSIIEDNKNELISSANANAEMHNALSAKQVEVNNVSKEMYDLRETITHLKEELQQKEEAGNANKEYVDFLSSELVELKKIISDNYEQLQKYEGSMNKNSETINDLNEKLNELNYKVVETEHIIGIRNEEIHQLKLENEAFEIKIKNLEEELKQNNDNFVESCRQLKEKCKFLENQIQTNSGCIEDIKGPLEAKVAELEKKNKEHVDKMKKIAANLKKKTVHCQELETKLAEFKEKWENENKEKDEQQKVIEDQQLQLDENQKRIQSLLDQLQDMESEISKMQLQFKEAKDLTRNYENQLEELRRQVDDKELLKEELTKLKIEMLERESSFNYLDMVLKQKEQEVETLKLQCNTVKLQSEESENELISDLKSQLESEKVRYETVQNALDAKLQEKDMYIESLEAENSKFRDKVVKLEEGLSTIEERRQLLEEKAVDLKVQLDAKSSAYEEASQFEQRLASLIAHDDIVEQKLEETTTENKTLKDKLKQSSEEAICLQNKLHETVSKLRDTEHNNEKVTLLENENIQLKENISMLHAEHKKLQAEFDWKLKEKSLEIETTDAELNSQLEELNLERKNVLARCEVLEDNIKEYADNEQLLNDELNELKQTVLNLKADLDNKLLELQNLNYVNCANVLKIEELQLELSNVQTQPQQTLESSVLVNTETLKSEVDNLHKLITQKDLDIQNYQRQNMQLQMAASFGSSSTTDVFGNTAFSGQQSTEKLQSLKNLLHETETRCSNLERQIRDVNAELESTRAELKSSEIRVAELEQEVLQQRNELVKQIAEEEVDAAILLAEKKVSKHVELQENLKDLQNRLKVITEERDVAIQKLNQLSLNAEGLREEVLKKKELFQTESSTSNEQSGESKEELLKKIKALQFMLFNVEKEKDDTVAQCHEFTNELTRLVYEREKLINDKQDKKVERTEVDLQGIEGEVVSNDDMKLTPEVQKELQNLEYLPVHAAPSGNLLQPVAEEVIEPKSAYLCFDNTTNDPIPLKEEITKDWGIEDDVIKSAVEAQVLQQDILNVLPEERKQFELFEYEPVHVPEHPQDQPKPVSETIGEPKSAYLCYPGEDTFASEEDGWGWNSEDTKFEAEHRQTAAASSRIEQLEEKINDLEIERSRLLEEIKTSQVRSGKLIKKLKEMKLKNDSLSAELNKKGSNDLCDLDIAIQDELNTRIKSLEKRLKELMDENIKEKSERENLLKRIDVLTSANERMVELKEKQDSDIQFWQFKNRELSLKLEQIEWGNESDGKSAGESPIKTSDVDQSIDYKKQTDELNKKIESLSSTVNELTLDNEDLQSMLEEERTLRIQAERTASNIPLNEILKTEFENENKHLKEETAKLNDEKKSLEQTISVYLTTNNEITLKIGELQLCNEQLSKTNNELKEKLPILEEENHQLQNQIKMVRLESEVVSKNQVEENQFEIIHLQNQLSALKEEKLQCENLLSSKEEFIYDLNLKMHQLESDKNAVQELLNNQNLEYDNMKQKLINLENKNTEITKLNNDLNHQKQLSEQKWSTTVESEIASKNQMEENHFEIIHLHNQLSTLKEEKLQFESLLSSKEEVICDLNLKIQQLESDKNALQELLNNQNSERDDIKYKLTALENKNAELVQLNSDLNHEKQLLEQKWSTTVEEIAKEWSEKVDQRGTDVSESWKLHLEAVEVEFAQKEQNLLEELNEERNKNGVIVNQNNDLQQKLELTEKKIAASDFAIAELQQTLSKKQSEILDLSQQLQNINVQLELKSNETANLHHSVHDLQAKEFEINQIKTQISANEQLLLSKDSDIESLKLQIKEKQQSLSKEETDKINLQTQLEANIARCNAFEAKIAELEALSESENTQIAELKQIIETQVLKIESLKQELYVKSSDYDALFAEFDTLHHENRHSLLQNHPEVPHESPKELAELSEMENILEPVSRAELDLALYMLHQRDVRCEELTVELMQLLEERDTLQLKLSNAIRINEELRTHLSPQVQKESEEIVKEEGVVKSLQSTGAIPKSKSAAIFLDATGTELAKEVIAETHTEKHSNTQLADKLSQLRSIGYRDKTLKDDQEARHLQQMSLMQQHRDIASKLPPEAAARLVDASYTLSRDVQSPSKVLLNWLWGRSTPKVNDV